MQGTTPVGPAPSGMVRTPRPRACSARCRPRARGDGSRLVSLARYTLTSAPRPRGWFVREASRLLRDAVGPAPAGMVPGRRTRSGPNWCRPRARGDGSPTLSVSGGAAWSAPRPRGWFGHHRGLHHRPDVVPAPAGMVPATAAAPTRSGSPPRARGDGSRSWRSSRPPTPSAPRPRGWFLVGVLDDQVGGVGPAPAGMVLRALRESCTSNSRPRARGDGSSTRAGRLGTSWSAPRPRGWFLLERGSRDPQHVGPAPAGMVPPGHPGHLLWSMSAPRPRGWIPAPRPAVRCARSRPRARGDGSRIGLVRGLTGGSAPRPRGWFPDPGDQHDPGGVGPAPAGMVLVPSRGSPPWPCRPRARGDGSSQSPSTTRSMPSAPRPRGWFSTRAVTGRACNVGPAPAGMVPAGRTGRGCSRRRPRARGDGSGFYSGGAVGQASAPRPRGWFVQGVVEGENAVVGPAPAGMVPRPARRGGARPRRPRARGDSSGARRRPVRGAPSTPRPRGWLVDDPPFRSHIFSRPQASNESSIDDILDASTSHTRDGFSAHVT